MKKETSQQLIPQYSKQLQYPGSYTLYMYLEKATLRIVWGRLYMMLITNQDIQTVDQTDYLAVE